MGDGAQTDPEMHSVTTQSVILRAIEISDLEVFLPLASARPLFAHVAKHNHASLRVLLRQGFVLTGKQIKESEDTQALIELKLN